MAFLRSFRTESTTRKSKNDAICSMLKSDKRNEQVEVAWQSASAIDTIKAYENFLHDWPRGQYSRAARTRLKRLFAADKGYRSAAVGEATCWRNRKQRGRRSFRRWHIRYVAFIAAIAVIGAVAYWSYTRGLEADQKLDPAPQTSSATYFVQVGAENDQTAALATYADIQQAIQA